jgi:hypothetical protein
MSVRIESLKQLLRSFPNKTELLQIFETLLVLKLNGFLWVYTSINDTVVTERGKVVPQLSRNMVSAPFSLHLSVFSGTCLNLAFTFFTMIPFQRIT